MSTRDTPNTLPQSRFFIWNRRLAMVVLAGTVVLCTLLVERGLNRRSSPRKWFAAGSVPSDFDEPLLRTIAINNYTNARLYIMPRDRLGRLHAIMAWHHGDLRIPINYNAEESRFDSCCYDMSYSLDGTPLDHESSRLHVAPAKILDSIVYVHLDTTTVDD